MDLSQSDLGLLLALDALFEEEAVTPAAKRLGISQPAMSAQLARLRRLFDDPLLIPSGRRMVLTERARAIREPLRRHLSDLDALVREAARFDPATTDATFRVMGTDYVHAAMGPTLSRRLAARAPGARLALLPAAAEAVWPALEDGRADAAALIVPPSPDARARRLIEEDFVVVQRVGHPRGRAALTVEAFVALDHILVSPEGGGFVGRIDELLAQAGVERRVALSAPSFLLAPALVAATDLVCVLPRRVASGPGVEAFELPIPSPRFEASLYWHARLHRDPAQVWFRAEAAAVFDALGPAPPAR